MRGLVYLCSPYTHPDPAMRQKRFEQACAAAGKLMRQGWCVFSPIAHSHPIEQYFGDGKIEGHDFWLKQDFAILDRSSRVAVLTLEGWERSTGIAREMERAHAACIPIAFVDPADPKLT